MVRYWLDTNSFITAKNGPYSFEVFPQFWSYIEEQGNQSVLASVSMVYEEIRNGGFDDLSKWAMATRDAGFFVEPDETCQKAVGPIADYVVGRYEKQHASLFLAGADPWVIAQAKVRGGKVVTFESLAPDSKRKVKIPNVCSQFGVEWLDLYMMLRELGARFF